jgi:poly(3-hydroxybutyrate) depolymerase
MPRTYPRATLALALLLASPACASSTDDVGDAGLAVPTIVFPDAGADALPTLMFPSPLDAGNGAFDAAVSPSMPDAALAPGTEAAAPGPTGSPGNLTPGTTTVAIEAAGMSRTFYLHVPAAASAGQVPLVLALHGNGDTAANFVTSLGLDTLSEQEGFVLAAPQGITRDVDVYEGGQVVTTVPQVDWDPYDSVQADGTVTSANNIDIPLLDAIRGQLVASRSIDVHHVVVYGYSQGGYMSLRYGMSDAADLACAAVLAAASPLSGTMLIEQAARTIPVVLQVGSLDDAYSNAEATVQELEANGNPTQWNPIAGGAHVPPPGDPLAPLAWCLPQSL